MPEVMELFSHLPERAHEKVGELIRPYSFRLIIRPMQSSLGRFQPETGDSPHRISMRHGMSKSLFLLVFLHELAHLQVYHLAGRNSKPHGREWKNAYRRMLEQMLSLQAFPEEMTGSLKEFTRNPTASMINKGGLYRHFEEFSAYIPVAGMNDYECFMGSGQRLYQLLPGRAKYLPCTELQRGRKVWIRRTAQVIRVTPDQLPPKIKGYISPARG